MEIILVDDGSPDNCPQICDSFAASDARIHVIHKSNGGLAEARNYGLAAATGDYVLFLDSDDYWDDFNAIERIVENLEENPVDVLLFGAKKYYQVENKIEEANWKVPVQAIGQDNAMELLMRNNLYTASACAKVVSLQLLHQAKINFVVGQLSEDIEYSIKLLLHAKHISADDSAFYVYRRQNQMSITANIGYKNLYDIAEVIQRYTQLCGDRTDRQGTWVCHFLALQYVLWMTVSNVVHSDEGKKLVKQMKDYWFLLKYDWYPYVRLVGKAKFMGYAVVRKLLGIYKKVK